MKFKIINIGSGYIICMILTTDIDQFLRVTHFSSCHTSSIYVLNDPFVYQKELFNMTYIKYIYIKQFSTNICTISANIAVNFRDIVSLKGTLFYDNVILKILK